MVTVTSKVALALIGAALATSSGCTNTFKPCLPATKDVALTYLRADYVAERAMEDTPAEVTAANVYRDHHTEWKTVAIRLPDTCVTESAATATGTSSTSQTIMATKCAFWLKELESTLTGAGYRVISWDALRRTLASGDSTYAAAANLGADIVFMVDRDLGDKRLATQSQITATYFSADASGNALGGALTPGTSAATTDDFARAHAPGLMQTQLEITAMSAFLDITAVVAATGETAWFYRRGLALPERIAAREAMSFLFAEVPSKTEGMVQRYPIWPAGVSTAEAAAPSAAVAVVTDTSTTTARPADQQRDLELKLVRTIVKDFVAAFTGNSP